MILPDEITNRFTVIAENIGRTHRQLGAIMDEYISDLPHGYHMQAYKAFAELYYQITGEVVSEVTVRHWRHSAMSYSKNNLLQFEQLSDSQLTEAVKLAEINNLDAGYICQWCVDNQIKSVPEMRAEWLPVSGPPEAIDPPALSGIIRLFGRLFKPDHPHRARIEEIITELRGYLIETVME